MSAKNQLLRRDFGAIGMAAGDSKPDNRHRRYEQREESSFSSVPISELLG